MITLSIRPVCNGSACTISAFIEAARLRVRIDTPAPPAAGGALLPRGPGHGPAVPRELGRDADCSPPGHGGPSLLFGRAGGQRPYCVRET